MSPTYFGRRVRQRVQHGRLARRRLPHKADKRISGHIGRRISLVPVERWQTICKYDNEPLT